MEKENFSFHIRLDVRRIHNDGKYPFQLFIYSKRQKKDIRLVIKSKEVSVDPRSSKNDFKRIWTRDNNGDFIYVVSSYNKDLRKFLVRFETKVKSILNDQTIHTFDQIKKELKKESIRKTDDLLDYLKFKKEQLYKEERYGSAESYSSTISKVKLVNNNKTISFYDINKKWFNKFEKIQIKEGYSRGSIGIDLRNIRSVFNDAIFNKIIPKSIYPFGRKGYNIPNVGKKKNRALLPEELKKLSQCIPNNYNKERARDFFMFSYYAKGMNCKDIALLKNDDFRTQTRTREDSNGNLVKREESYFEYSRERRINNLKKKRLIRVLINKNMKEIMKKYDGDGDFVFDIITDNNPKKIRSQYQAFTRFVNTHIKALAEDIKINKSISSGWARHSFGTILNRKGMPIRLISESFGHSSTIVTENYLNSIEIQFEDDVQKALEF